MKNEGKFIIYVNERYYWELSLVPEPNEHEEPINRCVLIDSEVKKEAISMAFDATWLLPIFQSRNQEGLRELAIKLKEVTDSLGIKTTPRSEMPQDKRIKETKPIARVINLKDKNENKEKK